MRSVERWTARVATAVVSVAMTAAVVGPAGPAAAAAANGGTEAEGVVAHALAAVGVGDGALAPAPGDDLEEGAASVPVDGGDGARLEVPGGADIGVGLPAVGDAVGAVDGALVYDGGADAVTVAAEPSPDGVRALVVLGEGAPTEHRFPLDLPRGAALAARRDGGVDVRTAGDGPASVLASIDPPWAVDADGRRVPTRYRLEGDVVVQEVDHEGAAHPVVADPKVSVGWFIYVRFSRNETLWIGRSRIRSASSFAATGCSPIPHPGAKLACVAVARARWRPIVDTFEAAARRSGRCVELKITHVPQVVVGWKGISC